MKQAKYDYQSVLDKKEREGLTLSAACRAMGVNIGAFNGWYYKGKGRKKARVNSPKRRSLPTVQTIPLPDNTFGKVLAFYGTPNDIAQAVRGLQ
jgi:hypothetical protein